MSEEKTKTLLTPEQLHERLLQAGFDKADAFFISGYFIARKQLVDFMLLNKTRQLATLLAEYDMMVLERCRKYDAFVVFSFGANAFMIGDELWYIDVASV